MTTAGAWADFDTLRHNIKHNTVDKLKHIITGFNEECGSHHPKSGKKQELIDRIVGIMETWRTTGQEDKWSRAKHILYQVQTSGSYSSFRSNLGSLPSTSTATNGYANHSAAVNRSSMTTSSALPIYNPYAAPHRPTAPTPATSGSAPRSQSIRFKQSPFFRIEAQVSGIQECPESMSSTDRKSQVLSFTLTNEHAQKLTDTSSKYQIRLFCTSSFFFSPAIGLRTASQPCPIEFPPTCEIRVNTQQLSVNLKGMKKKPGTTPPPDLGKMLRIGALQQNRVEIVYVNSQMPVQSKKFYLVAMLVEVTTVEQLVDRLVKGKYKSGEEIRQSMIQAVKDDDDIVAGPQKMSLKCPLTMMRVSTPCRSSHCVHSQCFDASSWLMVNEQTTTWMCPVCERGISYDDIIVDGYVDEILKQAPESVEDVMVEPDGEWHTTDHKYASATWKAAHPVAAVAPIPPTPSSRPQIHKPTSSSSSGGSHVNGINRVNGDPGKAKPPAVFVVDSDDENDEEEGRVKRELSPSGHHSTSVSAQSSYATLPPASQVSDYGGGGSRNTQPVRKTPSSANVIDLTLDSDNEDEGPPPTSLRVLDGASTSHGLPAPTLARLPLPPVSTMQDSAGRKRTADEAGFGSAGGCSGGSPRDDGRRMRINGGGLPPLGPPFSLNNAPAPAAASRPAPQPTAVNGNSNVSPSSSTSSGSGGGYTNNNDRHWRYPPASLMSPLPPLPGSTGGSRYGPTSGPSGSGSSPSSYNGGSPVLGSASHREPPPRYYPTYQARGSTSGVGSDFTRWRP